MALDISRYVSHGDNGMHFSQEQANHFAKHVAGDFNPIHDIGGKRFCVPGDLLFAALLNHYAVYSQLHVDFVALVKADVQVQLPQKLDVGLNAPNTILDSTARHLLSMQVSGESSSNKEFMASLIEQYVRFSGKTFPDILVELMRDNQVMINPARPLVIYKDMYLELDSLEGSALSLELDSANMEVDGKKGKATLKFVIKNGDQIIGRGGKNMLLSGLREYDEVAMQAIVDQYNEWRTAYRSAPEATL